MNCSKCGTPMPAPPAPKDGLGKMKITGWRCPHCDKWNKIKNANCKGTGDQP